MMASFSSISRHARLIIMVTLILLGNAVSADFLSFLFGGLSNENYYTYRNCPSALDTIKKNVKSATENDKRMGASLLRLHFHDCFVNGCDGSVLLDGKEGEKFASPNQNSLRGFAVIDKIKDDLGDKCRRIVSCADILAVAARDSIEELSGNSVTYKVNLGRKDSKTASKAAAEENLPSPFTDLNDLIDFFRNKGFTPRDLVALSGGHTIGKARCATFRNRIWNEKNIDEKYAKTRRETCPKSGNDTNLAPLDGSNIKFDNTYFTDLVAKKGLLHSDQQLYINGGQTFGIVEEYSKFPKHFFSDFGKAMQKMGKLRPPSDQLGEIRENCRKKN